MSMTNYFTSVVEPHFQKIGKFTLLKWGIYITETYTSVQVFETIYDRLKFSVNDKIYCWAYGSVSKCNYGIQMSFIGLLISLYTVSVSVFKFYMELPEIMDFREIDLCALKLGLWLIVGRQLDKWFVTKFTNKYGKNGGKPADRIKRIKRMDEMIGPDVRKVRKMYRFTIFLLGLSLLTMFVEKWDKKKTLKEKKNKI
mmetsp:Transcript_110065/g.164730  ORF Transcript_110065/g.164730 Transcript_110065/m.164730 type:complete len:198 (-) Transcript_110065:461-1054(-)